MKMFSNYNAYLQMLNKYFTKEFLNQHEKFIEKSFNLDVNIDELAVSLNKLN